MIPNSITRLLPGGGEGSRIDLGNPENSLILLKPTFQVGHGGGERFKVGSLEYRALLDWIGEGAAFDPPGTPVMETLSVHPGEITLVGIGSTARLIGEGRLLGWLLRKT